MISYPLNMGMVQIQSLKRSTAAEAHFLWRTVSPLQQNKGDSPCAAVTRIRTSAYDRGETDCVITMRWNMLAYFVFRWIGSQALSKLYESWSFRTSKILALVLRLCEAAYGATFNIFVKEASNGVRVIAAKLLSSCTEADEVGTSNAGSTRLGESIRRGQKSQVSDK